MQLAYTISEVKRIAENNDIQCLSSTYDGSDKKMYWKCMRSGHVFESTWKNIKKKKTGDWCLQCKKKRQQKKYLEIAKKIAKNRNGKCISNLIDIDKNVNSIVKFQCNKGHIWNTSIRFVRDAGTWCPECAYKFQGKPKNSDLPWYERDKEKV